MRHRFCLVLLSAIAVVAGCQNAPAGRSEGPPAAVAVVAAGKKTVPIQIRTIGIVKALATVAIRPRVGGQLKDVFFKEGNFVDEKQKLFAIDPEPYEAAVKQAVANMARNAALLKGAELDLKRAEAAKLGGVAAPNEYDAALTAVASARAAVEADRAAINTAQLQASFTTIHSPIKGRVGELLVYPGNQVEANGANPLVVINQISPISVAFTLPEQRLPEVLAARKSGAVKVEVDLRGGGPLATGQLSFIDNTADPQTGTVQFKAAFVNDDQKLWPGLFVDVVVTLGERPDSVVVPTAALQSGQKGQYVYVITADWKAEVRPVEVAFEYAGEAIIASGLKAGDTVVVEGQLRLAAGVKVDARPWSPRASLSSAPGLPK